MTAMATTARVPALGRTARTFGYQTAAELRRHLRAPDFAIAAIALPVVFYLMFGAPRAAEPIPGGGTVGGYLIVAFAVYGVLSVGLFGIGATITEERGRGDLRLVRATPLPGAAYLGAKIVFVVAAAAVITVLLGVCGILTGAGMSLSAWAGASLVLVASEVALVPLGFLVGFLARPGSAAAVSLLILMPLSLAAGVFMPVSELPSIVRPIAELTPTYHAAELARWAGGVATTGVPLTDAAWVAGWAAIGTAVVVIAYRRFVGRQFA